MGPSRVCVKSSLFGAAFGLSPALALESFKSRIRASCPLQSGHHDGLSRNARYELAPGGRERRDIGATATERSQWLHVF